MSASIELAHIVACDEDNGIGKQKDLAWHIREDLQHFKALTQGGVLLMGRTTFESLPGVLPGRVHVVLTHQRNYVAPAEVFVAHTLNEAVSLAKDIAFKHAKQRVWVIGGATLYAQTKSLASHFEITRVKGTYECDAFYPELPEDAELVCSASAKDERIEAFETYAIR